MWRLRPALPMMTFSWSMLPTWPMVAMQFSRNVAQLAGGQTDQRISAFFCHQLSLDAGGAGQLSTFSGIQLHVVDESTDRDVGQRQRVAWL